MKDHRERTARLQLIESMFTGHAWQTAVALSQLHVSRSTAYRLVKLARDDERGQARSVCVQQPGLGPRSRGSLSQRERRCRPSSRRKTVGSGSGGAAWVPTRRAAGANGVSPALVASIAQKAHSLL